MVFMHCDSAVIVLSRKKNYNSFQNISIPHDETFAYTFHIFVFKPKEIFFPKFNFSIPIILP